MKFVKHFHAKHVFDRRVSILGELIKPLVSEQARLLDVGCGDGSIASLLKQQRPDISIEGIDVFVREDTVIPVTPFDGRNFPFPDDSFDDVLFVDVLHHTADPTILLKEAKRVARRSVILKDHTRDGLLADSTLRFMDWVGNAPHGVALPYNYWPERQWRHSFDELNLNVEFWSGRLELYPWPASLLFDRSLHFIARLTP